ncbi:MAG: hypothetical protein WD801_08395 [Gemmatimonadaceae bacterium]
MIKTSVEPWIETPLRAFVLDAGVQLALLLHPSGQVLAQHGFVRAVDVMSACALAAAIHASSSELGRQLEGKPFRGLHAGTGRQIFLAEAETARGPYIFLTVFDQDSSLGLVRMYFEELQTNLASAAPPPVGPQGPVLSANFEGELNRNLAELFGRP